ncbi:MAG: metal-dependent transcriptional regulator [Alphaproteobacteria bacterium]|uniref:Metal-dependent transcriptional regulator n=1 Tax=Candidatus Nitrobium versatile TaxID=2884831 RepID=A0A953LWA3_9BACT|nr:metal-dependent transcriptional regulator [Candidatus Nitrobium versatile]
MEMEKERIDEALELLWVMGEEGYGEVKRFELNSDDPDIEQLILSLKSGGLVSVGDSRITLTEKGNHLARGLIRRHRLAERLFTDVFDLPKDAVCEDACKMEHILSEELTDSVCTFLGHPPTCPHGKPIPRGECCKKYAVDVRPVVVRLTDFEVGQQGKIVFITPSEAARISRLSSIGIIPGTTLRLLQRKPSVVLQIDETTIAIDPELARDIFVKKVV